MYPRSKIGTAESERRRESREGIYRERDRGRYKQRGREKGRAGGVVSHSRRFEKKIVLYS